LRESAAENRVIAVNMGGDVARAQRAAEQAILTRSTGNSATFADVARALKKRLEGLRARARAAGGAAAEALSTGRERPPRPSIPRNMPAEAQSLLTNAHLRASVEWLREEIERIERVLDGR